MAWQMHQTSKAEVISQPIIVSSWNCQHTLEKPTFVRI